MAMTACYRVLLVQLLRLAYLLAFLALGTTKHGHRYGHGSFVEASAVTSTTSSLKYRPDERMVPLDDVLVVVTVGGEVTGLSHQDGSILWKLDGNDDASFFAPLVSTSHASSSEGESPWGGGISAVPSVDGRVVYHGIDGILEEGLGLSSPSMSIPDLVSRTPFFDSSGNYYVGERRSSVAVLDAGTGKLYGTTTDTEDPDEDRTSSSDNNNNHNFWEHMYHDWNSEDGGPEDTEKGSMLWLGRVDYRVSIYDASTMEHAVTFTTARVMTMDEMVAVTDSSTSASTLFPHSLNEPDFDFSLAQIRALPKNNDDPAVLLSTPEGDVALVRDETVEWTMAPSSETTNQQQSVSPVAYAFQASSGTSVRVHVVPERQLQSPFQPSHLVMGTGAETVVRALPNGERYAIRMGPMDVNMEVATKIQGPRPSLAGFLPWMEDIPPSSQQHQQQQQQQMHMQMPQSAQAQFHHHQYQRKQQQQQQYSPPQQFQQRQQQPQYNMYQYQYANQYKNPSTYGYQYYDPSHQYLGTAQQNYDPFLYQNNYNNNNKGKRKWYRTFLKVMTSWIPPAVALAFVLSFEMGRRERLKKAKIHVDYNDMPTPSSLVMQTIKRRNANGMDTENEEPDSSHNNNGDEPLLSLSSSQQNKQDATKADNVAGVSSQLSSGIVSSSSVVGNPSNNSTIGLALSLNHNANPNAKGNANANANQNQQQVIEVSDRILGYGGHGTVVYAGRLGGRSVAVKRLLKTYHASADREISLLISSDGHPNVVRYFWKETRHDFVYLALELCDATLDDLIGRLALIGRGPKGRSRGGGGSSNPDDGETNLNHPKEEKEEEEAANAQFRRRDMELRNMLHRIAEGVRHLHGLRIVHRDLKPQNILLQRSPQIKGKNFSSSSSANTTTAVEEHGADEDMVSILELGGWIPKLSDMGLGKQLYGGQTSSFGGIGAGAVHHGASSSGMGAALSRHDGSGSALAAPGSVGWQAPELMSLRSRTQIEHIHNKRTTTATMTDGGVGSISAGAVTSSRSVDVFSLGCIFHMTLDHHPLSESDLNHLPNISSDDCHDNVTTMNVRAHRHPYGEWYEREANLMRPNFAVEVRGLSMEARDLTSHMLSRNPRGRPTADEVCRHPLFWEASRRLAFLSEFSDRVEAELLARSTEKAGDSDTDTTTTTTTATTFFDPTYLLEQHAAEVVGSGGWDLQLDPGFFATKFRTYDPSSVRDCLRVLRNKAHHYDELPSRIRRDVVGPTTDDLMVYFDDKFPRLLGHCYGLCRDHLSAASDDALMQKFRIPVRKTHSKSSSSSGGCTGTIDVVGTVASADKNGDTPLASSMTASEETCSDDKPKELVGTKADTDKDMNDTETTTTPSLLSSTKSLSVSNSENECSEVQDEPLMTTSTSSPSDSLVTSLVDVSQHPLDHSQSFTLPPTTSTISCCPTSVVLWERSDAANAAGCRGWMRGTDRWTIFSSENQKSFRHPSVTRCAEDPRFRTRLCNHWDVSRGTRCPIRRCVFAHGPAELRVKEAKKGRWGTLVNEKGDCQHRNPRHSGGEDTYGAARDTEAVRKDEGKWNTHTSSSASSGANGADGRAIGGNNHGRGRGGRTGSGRGHGGKGRLPKGKSKNQSNNQPKGSLLMLSSSTNNNGNGKPNGKGNQH